MDVVDESEVENIETLLSYPSKDDVEREDINETDTFTIRFNCVISWFLKCSWNYKLKCLNQFLIKLKDESYLGIILTSLNYRIDKLSVYSKATLTTNYIYDKKLNDHSRSLDKPFLEETFQSDLRWFEDLQVQKQMDVIIELLKLGGGALIDKFYDCAVRVNEERRRGNDGKKKDEIIQEVSEHDSSTRVDRNPLVKEMEKCKKIWLDTITTYSNEILGIIEKKGPSARDSKKSRNRKNKNTEKHSKGSFKKSSKSSRTASGKDKGKKGNTIIDVVDQIQQLPVWIVKKIFGYLDQKTLKNVKDVNSYWSYVIDDLAKENATRKYMNKTLKKMEKSIQDNDSDHEYKTRSHTSNLQKRLVHLAERGATIRKLRGSGDFIRKATLLEAAAHENVSSFVTVTEGYESFPRNSCHDETLLKTDTCVLSEAGKLPFKFKNSSKRSRRRQSGSSGSSSTASNSSGGTSTNVSSDSKKNLSNPFVQTNFNK